uniref:Uncharacterized protein n=1 Tax=Ciona intestinalis TaxID=7719 RepID=H2Y0N4_CIOIN
MHLNLAHILQQLPFLDFLLRHRNHHQSNRPNQRDHSSLSQELHLCS